MRLFNSIKTNICLFFILAYHISKHNSELTTKGCITPISKIYNKVHLLTKTDFFVRTDRHISQQYGWWWYTT